MLPPLVSALSFTARDLGPQGVESRRPEASEAVEPLVDITQRRTVDRIEPALAVRTNRGESVLPQHLEVLRHRRLTYRELFLNLRTDGSRRQLAPGEQFENAPTYRVAQNIERVHILKLKHLLI